MTEVMISSKHTDQDLQNTTLMLILNVKTRWSSTHQMLRKQFITIPDLCLKFPQDVHLIIGRLLITLLPKTGNSTPLNSAQLTGMPSLWLRNGLNRFSLLPHKCPALKHLCSHQHMLSSVVSKRTFVSHLLNFLTVDLQN